MLKKGTQTIDKLTKSTPVTDASIDGVCVFSTRVDKKSTETQGTQLKLTKSTPVTDASIDGVCVFFNGVDEKIF